MQSVAFWETILRNGTVCALTSSRLDDFSDIVTYDNNIFGGGGGGKRGLLEGWRLYPTNTQEKNL